MSNNQGIGSNSSMDVTGALGQPSQLVNDISDKAFGGITQGFGGVATAVMAVAVSMMIAKKFK